MALTARKKTAVLMGAGGLLTVGVAAVVYMTKTTPDWVSLALAAIGAVANILGFSIKVPELPKEE